MLGGTRRHELVQAAFDRIAEVGMEGLRLRQVAADVGLDNSTVHHYFATKRALVVAVAEMLCQALRSTLPDGEMTSLDDHLSLTSALFRARPELATVAVELELHARRDPMVATALEAEQMDWQRALLAMVIRSEVDPAVVHLVTAACRGVRLSPESAGVALEQLGSLVRRSPARPQHRTNGG